MKKAPSPKGKEALDYFVLSFGELFTT